MLLREKIHKFLPFSMLNCLQLIKVQRGDEKWNTSQRLHNIFG